jgi:hypothetical protein
MLVAIRKQLITPKYEKGELSGSLLVTAQTLSQLQALAGAGVVEDIIVVNGSSVSLQKVMVEQGQEQTVPVTLYTKNVPGSAYYEDLAGFVQAHQTGLPKGDYYIHELAYFSSSQQPLPTALAQFQEVSELVTLLCMIADYVQDEVGEPQKIILFQKRKLVIPVLFHRNNLRKIDFLAELRTELCDAHDKEERKSIFKTELVATLFEVPEEERFSKLLENARTLYDQYIKSHLLYLDKFSYHDLKSEVDNDKLDYTKKIYGTVNDIQTKLIAVPAAFLLVLSQFDISGKDHFKNSLIVVASILFSVLLEILLTNQFGVLRYLDKEILQFKAMLKNKDTELDLNEFIQSFGDLDPIIKKQRAYLWLFRIITWSVPLTALIMWIVSRSSPLVE